MTKKRKSGFYWHVHHNKLIEWCYDVDERLEVIRTLKPAEEQELRERLFQPVKSKLPQELLETGKVYDKAWAAHNKAWAAYYKARAAHNKARAAYYKAWAALNKLLLKYESKIKELHAKECPNCPWDGETIFPERE